MKKNKNYKKLDVIIQVGNDQITEKATYYARSLVDQDIQTIYFSEDRSGLSGYFISSHNLDAVIASNNLIKRWIDLFFIFQKRRPIAVEMYLSQRPWHLIYYYLLARFFGANVIVWCRGELRNYFTHHPLRRLTNKFLLLRADKVLMRENYMKDILIKAKIYDDHRFLLFPNAIPVPSLLKSHTVTSNTVLFLNSFKSFRRVEVVIKAANLLCKKYPKLRFKLVGSTLDNNGYSPSSDSYEIKLRKDIDTYNLKGIVEILPFTSDRLKYFDDAFAFVLPADIVFCNYSLLEAMSYEIPPIIAESNGSELLVDNKKSGFIVQKNAKAFANAIEILYLDKNLQIRMGQRSREIILNKYNASRRVELLANVYRRQDI